jgi:hypothetical protein
MMLPKWSLALLCITIKIIITLVRRYYSRRFSTADGKLRHGSVLGRFMAQQKYFIPVQNPSSAVFPVIVL